MAIFWGGFNASVNLNEDGAAGASVLWCQGEPERRSTLLLLWHGSNLSRDNLCTPSSGVTTALLCGSSFLARHYLPLSWVSATEKRITLSQRGGESLSGLSDIRSSPGVWSFLAPVAWSRTSFGNLCVHDKVMSGTEHAVWLFLRWGTCQVRRRQSRWLFSSAVTCGGKNWLTSEGWQRRLERHGVKTEQSETYWYARQFRHWWLSVLQRKSKLQDVMRGKTNTWLWHFSLSLCDLIWFEVPVCTKAHYSKRNVKKWNIYTRLICASSRGRGQIWASAMTVLSGEQMTAQARRRKEKPAQTFKSQRGADMVGKQAEPLRPQPWWRNNICDKLKKA